MASLYTVYATAQDVSDFTGIALVDLPSDIDILLERASDLVNQTIHMSYDSSNQFHVEAVKYATCWQVNYWIEVGQTTDMAAGSLAGAGSGSTVKIGSFTVQSSSQSGGNVGTRADSGGTLITLQNGARNYLERVGLLSRKVGLK